MDEIQLVYVSKAAETIRYQDLEDILNLARIKNPEFGLTGCLIYRDDYFLQILEGPKKNIEQLLKNIKKDIRNDQIKVLYEGPLRQRVFGQWSMAFVDGDIASNATDSLLELFSICINNPTDSNKMIEALVQSFKQGAELR